MKTNLEQDAAFDPVTTDDQRWHILRHRDKRSDHQFVYSVITTGVYCRPSCASRLPRRQNVRFHATASDAERAGFRACKRCQPDHPEARADHALAVAKACRTIVETEEIPDLRTLARSVNLSPSHFHRVFKSVTGVSPKRYAIAHRSRRVRRELLTNPTVTSAIYRAGYNSSGRFYAASNKLLGMRPAAFRAGGAGVKIRFAVGECSLGSILVAASEVGICSISLGDDPKYLLEELQRQFPKAELIGGDSEFERTVAKVIGFVEDPARGLNLPLDIQGTAFQQRVWEELSRIPCGGTRTYSQIAREIGAPTATRAVAGACAANRIAIVIPCHRVIRTNGSLSGYRWGVQRKAKLLKRERRADVLVRRDANVGGRRSSK